MADGSIVWDFFISRADAQRDLARAIAEIARAAGFRVWLQDDFGGASFMAQIERGLDGGARVVALLSTEYQESDFCRKEYNVVLARDPLNFRAKRLVVLRVDDCEPGGNLTDIGYTDLVPLLNDASQFARAVRVAIGAESGQGAFDFLTAYRRSPKQTINQEVRPVPGFTGREAELQAVEAALWGKGGTAALTQAAMKGLGGVGKSVLAQEYAWRNRARYHGVWWIRAEKAETLLDDLIELGAKLIPGIKEVPERAQAAHATLAAITQMKAEKPWLLIYDNVEQPGDIDKLTPTEGAHVLITSRWSDWGKAASPVKIGVFPPDVAAQFLLDATGRNDREGAEKLAAELGFLPLALDHAAVYCKRTGMAFDAYRELAAELIRKAPTGADYKDEKPVFATFELAIQKAAHACPHAETLMGICAFLAPDRIPLAIVTTDVVSEIERGEAVAALQEVSLVTPETLDDGSAGVSVHRLVQEVMRGRLGNAALGAAAVATALLAKAFPFDSDYPEHWPTCRRLENHAIAVLAFAPDIGQGSESTGRLLTQYALHLGARAEFAAAEPLIRRSIAIGESTLGSEHPTVALRLNNLAQLLQDTNRLAEAEPLMRRALAIDETSFGPDHPEVATDLNNLAGLLQATNRLAEAEPLMRRMIAIFEKVERDTGHMHPNYAGALNNLAQLLKATNRLAEAKPLMRRALAIFEASLGAEHRSTQTVRGNLAILESEPRGETGAASATLSKPAPRRPGLLRRLLRPLFCRR